MKFRFKIILCVLVLLNYSSHKYKLCKAEFNNEEIQFVSYTKDQPIKMITSDYTVINFKQIYYKREFAKNCRRHRCSSENETYKVGYTSNYLDFYVSIDAGDCTNSSLFTVMSDAFKAYNPNRWIFAEQPSKLTEKYPTLFVEGIPYKHVYEIEGRDKNLNKIYLLYNQSAGVIKLTFADGTSFTRIE